MDEYAAMIGITSESTSKGVPLDGARTIALKHIEAFIMAFMEPQIIAAASSSFAPSVLAKLTENIQIHEAAHLRCSGSEIGRFVSMLRNPSSILKSCAAFALFQVYFMF